MYSYSILSVDNIILCTKVKNDHVEGHLHFYFGKVSSKMLFLNFMDFDLQVGNSFKGLILDEFHIEPKWTVCQNGRSYAKTCGWSSIFDRPFTFVRCGGIILLDFEILAENLKTKFYSDIQGFIISYII